MRQNSVSKGGLTMTTLTVDISDDRFAKLKEVAKGLLITPEELVTASIEDLLARPEEDFEYAVNYVLKKNTELYRRLA
jgi:antitoxin FitA